MSTAEFDSRLRHVRQPRRTEPRLKPVPTAAPTPQVAVTVLSTDVELCDAIKAAAELQYPVSVAATLQEAMQLAAAGKGGILVTDQALSRNALGQMSRQMRAHDPATITIAVGNRGDDNALIGLLSSAVVERFMLKPVQPTLARLVLRSAASEYQSLKHRPAFDDDEPAVEEKGPKQAPAVVPLPTALAPVTPDVTPSVVPESAPVMVEPRVAAAATTPPARMNPWPWLAAVAAAVIVGLGVWMAMQSRMPTIDPAQVVATNLAAATRAIEAGRFVDPPESSALHYYSVVLSLDATNADAKRGMEAIATHMVNDVKQSILDGRLAEAGIALERLRRISPDNRRVALMENELRRQQAEQMTKLQAAMVAPAVVEAKPAARTAKVQKTPTKKPVEEATLAIEDAAPIAAATTLSASKPAPLDMGPPAPDRTVPSAGEGASTETIAAAASLPAVVINPPEPVAKREPKLVKAVQAEFPKEARERSLSGWVDMTLAVTSEGDVVGVRVNSAENGYLFERPAIAAAKRWRYEAVPTTDPGAMHAVRVRMRFKLED